jgi:photosystem II stability/assembly factor-like uncharacterized protein
MILYMLVSLTAALLLSLSISNFNTNKAVATPDEVRWSRVNIPSEGVAGNWVLAKDSSIRYLTMASDGTLYCYANPSGTSYTLFKSGDGGCSWSYTGGVQDEIVALATVPDNDDIVYYATTSNVFKSNDAGKSFSPLPAEPGGAGTDNISITCIDVARLSGSSVVAVGTADSDSSQYGGIHTLDESEAVPGWTDTGISGYDVCAVAFSPDFTNDRRLMAVVTNEQDTLVTTKVGDGGWGQDISDAVITGVVTKSATITFPDDYGALGGELLFTGLDTGGEGGDVYSVNGKQVPEGSIATDLNVGTLYGLSNLDISGLAVNGNGTSARILAGASGSNQVYLSTDGGGSWVKSTKEPTGQSETCLVISDNFASSGIAYATTSGTESAFSRTTDGGVTWNQTGLIDSEISKSCIIDLAISPRHRQDNTLFMLTFDAEHLEHSLWRSLSDGIRWERIFTGTLVGVDSIKFVKLSPQYSANNSVLFLAGISNGNPAIWKSTDNGQSFVCREAPYNIDTWVVVNDNTLFLSGYDGSNGLVYQTTDSGISYSSEVTVGNQSIYSIVLSPNYQKDGTILAGNNNGWVYYSSDNGNSFKPLPSDAMLPPLTDLITVAFDVGFAGNGIIYAASSSIDEGIYRFIVNKSTEWERIDGNLSDDGTLNQLAVSADGALYVANSQPVDTAKKEGGMERSVDPSFPLNPTFETVTRGLDDGATLIGLWLQGNQLWSIDTTNTRLMTFIDSLVRPVFLVSPANKATGINSRNVILEWESPSAATECEWRLDYDIDLSIVPENFEGSTGASSVRFSELEADTTYNWRVRVTKPVLSQWSAKWSFTTALGYIVIAPELINPKAGAEEVSVKPLFQWSAIDGAKSYELMVSDDTAFESPLINKIEKNALPATAWQSDTDLNYNTTYYWKVRAIGSSSQSAWSAVSAFVTVPLPVLSRTVVTPALLSPEAGAGGVSVRPLFQWDAVTGADSYELIVCSDDTFTSPVINRTGDYTLQATAWQSNIGLDYNTTYYWKVRAISEDNYSAWSAMSAFTTGLSPDQPLVVQESPSSTLLSSSMPSQLSVPNWVIYLCIGLLLITMLIISVTLLLMVIALRRTKAG